MAAVYKLLNKGNVGTATKVASNDWDLVVNAFLGATSGIPAWVFRTTNKIGFADNVFWIETATGAKKINFRTNTNTIDTNLWIPVLTLADNTLVIGEVANTLKERTTEEKDIAFKASSQPATPGAGEIRLWLNNSDSKLKFINSSGTIFDLNVLAGGDSKAIIREADVQVGSISRPINFSVASDFTITENNSLDQTDIRIADNAITNTLIATHTSTKITISNSTQLPSNVALKNISNIFTEPQRIEKDAVTILTLHRPTNIVNSEISSLYTALNSVSTEITYGEIRAIISNNTSGSEAGYMRIYTRLAGSLRAVAQFQTSGDFLWGANLRGVISEAGLTVQRVFTFPDSSQKLLGETNTATVTTKTINEKDNTLIIRQLASYVLWEDTGIYYARNTKTGAITSNTSIATLWSSINSALFSAGGGIVLFKQGTYAFGNNNMPIWQNIHVIGEGWSVSIFTFNGLANATNSITMTANTSLRSLKVQGNVSTAGKPATTPSHKIGLGADHCVIEDTWITDLGYGIDSVNASNVRIKNVRIDKIRDVSGWAASIHISGNGDDIIIDGFEISDSDRAIETEDGAQNGKVENGFIKDITNGGTTGPNFSLGCHSHDAGGGCDNLTFKNVTMINTMAPDCFHAGTSFADADMPKNITFENITVDNPNHLGAHSGHNITYKNIKYVNDTLSVFQINRNSRNWKLENIEFIGLQTTKRFLETLHSDIIGITVDKCKIQHDANKDTTGHYSIYLTQGSDIKVINSELMQIKGFSGIYVATAVVNPVVNDNYIHYATTTPANYGIWSDATNAIISGNRFAGVPGIAHIVCRDGAIRNDISKNYIPDSYIWVRNTASYTNVHDNIISPAITGILIEATASELYISNNINYRSENGGLATFSGNASTKIFNIAHGLKLAPLSVPGNGGFVSVEPNTDDANGNPIITYDATNIIVTYAVAPPSGTNNVKLLWRAKI